MVLDEYDDKSPLAQNQHFWFIFAICGGDKY